MLSYYDKVRLMKDETIMKEIDNLTKKINRSAPGSQIYEQLVDMYHTANEEYQERLMTRDINREDTVLEIGSIESKVHTPDYNKKELLDVMVTQYTQGLGRTT
jgi:hypothetical protein